VLELQIGSVLHDKHVIIGVRVGDTNASFILFRISRILISIFSGLVGDFQVLYDLPTQTSITSLAVLVSVVFVAVVAVAVIVCGCHRRFPSFAIKAALSFWVLCTDGPVARPSRGPVSRMRYDVTVGPT